MEFFLNGQTTSDVEILRATVFHTPANPFQHDAALVAYEDGAVAVREGRIVACGRYSDVHARWAGATTTDWRGGVIVPGLVDTHTHFPQLRILGCLGLPLLDWLEQVALPEEARMADVAYASDTARRFVSALAAHGTTTALVFGAHFAGATAALFEAATAAGLRMATGLVCSDRSLRAELRQTPAAAYGASTELVKRFHKRGRLLYAVTPRFAPSASEGMLEVCQTLLDEHADLRFQTHINENADEVAQCARLFPWAADYLAVYERYQLTGPRAVLAHDVHATRPELERLAGTRTSIAHCPASNANLGSGIFPMRRHMDAGVHCSLGTDVGAGIGFGMMREALQAYLMQRVADDGVALDPARLLYLATRAGAEAMGLADETGDFATGKAADLVYFHPHPGSVLASAFERAQSAEDKLAALFAAGGDCVHEVRVEGDTVFRSSAP